MLDWSWPFVIVFIHAAGRSAPPGKLKWCVLVFRKSLLRKIRSRRSECADFFLDDDGEAALY